MEMEDNMTKHSSKQIGDEKFKENILNCIGFYNKVDQKNKTYQGHLSPSKFEDDSSFN